MQSRHHTHLQQHLCKAIETVRVFSVQHGAAVADALLLVVSGNHRPCFVLLVACRYVWASLLPIVGGCSLSAMKEVSFSWGGFNNAMISNLGMVLRNIYSKKSLNDYKVLNEPPTTCAVLPVGPCQLES